MSKPKNQLVPKSKSCLEEPDKYQQIINTKNRSGKTLELLNEKLLTHNICKDQAKTSGFLTERPLLWLVAFETLIKEYELPHASFNNPNETGTFFETQISFFESGNKVVTAHIYLSTGVILFKGQAHKTWSEKYMDTLYHSVNELSMNSPNKTDIASDENQINSANEISTSDINVPSVPANNFNMDQNTNIPTNFTILSSPPQTDSAATDISEFNSESQPSPINLTQFLQSDDENNNLSPDYIYPTQQVPCSSVTTTAVITSSHKSTPISHISECTLASNGNKNTILSDSVTTQNTCKTPKNLNLLNVLPSADPSSSPLVIENTVNMNLLKTSTPVTRKTSVNLVTTTPYTNQSTKSSENNKIELLSEQLKALWSENKKIHNSIDAMSDGIQNTSKTLTNVQDALISQSNRLETLIKKMSIDFDTKLETFMLAIDNVVDKKVLALEKRIDDKLKRDLTDINTKLNKREGDFKNIEDCFSSYTVCIDTKVNEALTKFDSLDFSSLNTWGDLTDNNANAISDLKIKIENINTHLSHRATSECVDQKIKKYQTLALDNTNNLASLDKSIHQVNNKCNTINKHYNEIEKTVANLNKSVCDLFQSFNLMKEQFDNLKSNPTHPFGHNMHSSYAAAATNFNNTIDMSVRKKIPPTNSNNAAHCTNNSVLFGQGMPSSLNAVAANFNPYPADMSLRNKTNPVVSLNVAQHVNADPTPNPFNYNNYDTTLDQFHSSAANSSSRPITNHEKNINNTNKSPHKAPKNLLICWDSNKKYINTRRLCSLNTTEFASTPVLQNVYKTIVNCTITSLKTILIHCGTNDAEYYDISHIIQSFRDIVLLNNKFSNINIIISSLLPRKDKINDKIQEINKAIEAEFSNNENITIIFHKNLNSRFESEKNSSTLSSSILQDEKHLAQRAAPMFAGNIKFALRRSNMLPSERGFRRKNAELTGQVSSKPADIFQSQRDHTAGATDQVSRKSLFCEAMLEVFDRFL